MQVRMLTTLGVPSLGARAARSLETVGERALAQQVLAQPQREALLAYATGAREEQAGRQTTVGGSGGESLPQRVMTEEGAQWHTACKVHY